MDIGVKREGRRDKMQPEDAIGAWIDESEEVLLGERPD